jgi:hypothetical protein
VGADFARTPIETLGVPNCSLRRPFVPRTLQLQSTLIQERYNFLCVNINRADERFAVVRHQYVYGPSRPVLSENHMRDQGCSGERYNTQSRQVARFKQSRAIT